MTNAKRDADNVPVGLAWDATAITPQPLLVDAATNQLLVDVIVASPVIVAATAARRDANNVPTEYGVSSVDGTTLVPIRTDTNGRILLDV